ncbi:MAG: hypothetical protein ACI97A_001151 [Planctomycetota bacterium]|jgi:hypothetical protein
MTTETSSLDDYAAGSVLKRDLVGVPGKVYSHVGIYIGAQQIIHFNGEFGSGSEAKIVKSSLEEFSKGRKIRVQAQPESIAHGQATCEEAHRVLSNPNAWDGKYALVTKNCEDFTHHCFRARYQETESDKQKKGSPPWTQRLKTVATTTVAIVIGIVTVGAAKNSKGGRPPRS